MPDPEIFNIIRAVIGAGIIYLAAKLLLVGAIVALASFP